jgi:hypothetical protein
MDRAYRLRVQCLTTVPGGIKIILSGRKEALEGYQI